MQPVKYTVAIIESSPVISKGISAILHDFLFIGRVVELNPDYLWTEQIEMYLPDAIIINSLMTENIASIKHLLNSEKKVLLIAINSHLVKEKHLSHFDASFSIYDNPDTIEAKLKILQTHADTAIHSYTNELSDREKEILIALTKGLSNKEIADFFNISIHTVITHRRNITRKLDIHSVSGLTVYAIVNKLIDIGEIK
jgi:DNA-binding NarL/FixJ family response regulator